MISHRSRVISNQSYRPVVSCSKLDDGQRPCQNEPQMTQHEVDTMFLKVTRVPKRERYHILSVYISKYIYLEHKYIQSNTNSRQEDALDVRYFASPLINSNITSKFNIFLFICVPSDSYVAALATYMYVLILSERLLFRFVFDYTVPKFYKSTSYNIRECNQLCAAISS